MNVFIGEFQSVEDIIKEFHVPRDALDGADVLLAWYGLGFYCGDAFVLFRKGGKLFEVNSSHCSSFGLRGTWAPEETSKEALSLRNIRYCTDGGIEADTALKGIVATL